MARVHDVLIIGSGFGGSIAGAPSVTIAAWSNWVASRFLGDRA